MVAPETPLVTESEDRDAADVYRFVPTLTGGDLDVGLWHGSHADSGELWDIGDVVFQVGPTHRTTVASSLVPWAGDEGQQVWRVSPQQPRRLGHVPGVARGSRRVSGLGAERCGRPWRDG